MRAHDKPKEHWQYGGDRRPVISTFSTTHFQALLPASLHPLKHCQHKCACRNGDQGIHPSGSPAPYYRTTQRKASDEEGRTEAEQQAACLPEQDPALALRDAGSPEAAGYPCSTNITWLQTNLAQATLEGIARRLHGSCWQQHSCS